MGRLDPRDMYRLFYNMSRDINTIQRSSGVFCVGYHNWLNGRAAALFVGEYPMCRQIITNQKRYLVKILGLVVQTEEEIFITFGASTDSDTVLSISMAVLPAERAERYRRIKAARTQIDPDFVGIIDSEIGDTATLAPVVPDTGAFPAYDPLKL